MSGDSDDEHAHEWRWAHILWQRHHLRMEDFADMPRTVQLAYIASEQLEDKNPLSSTNQIKKGLFTKSKKRK